MISNYSFLDIYIQPNQALQTLQVHYVQNSKISVSTIFLISYYSESYDYSILVFLHIISFITSLILWFILNSFILILIIFQPPDHPFIENNYSPAFTVECDVLYCRAFRFIHYHIVSETQLLPHISPLIYFELL